MTDYATGGTIPPREPSADEIPAFLSPCGYLDVHGEINVELTQEQADRIKAAFQVPPVPAPTDHSWITFEPAPRSLWARIRRLWHRDGLSKREADVLKEAFLDAQGGPPSVLADDAIQLKDVARLDLKPGDTLVVTLAGNPSAEDAHEAKRRILAILGNQLDEHHLLVMPETAKVSILRTDGDQP